MTWQDYVGIALAWVLIGGLFAIAIGTWMHRLGSIDEAVRPTVECPRCRNEREAS